MHEPLLPRLLEDVSPGGTGCTSSAILVGVSADSVDTRRVLSSLDMAPATLTFSDRCLRHVSRDRSVLHW